VVEKVKTTDVDREKESYKKKIYKRKINIVQLGLC
jgi:hypothetical protein